jgi:hypothetical protein
MTIGEFLETNEGRHARLKTDFSTCELEEHVQGCLRRMKEGESEWMALIDDEYFTGGIRRQDLIDAIEAKKPDDRWLVEKSPVGPYAYPLTIVAHPEDDAREIARRLAFSHQPDLLITNDRDQPMAVIDSTALTEHPQFRDAAQTGIERESKPGEPS